MTDFRDMAQDPKHGRTFEKLLRLAAGKGDVEQVAERLGWGIDANCQSKKGRTPLIANVRGPCPSVAVVLALLKAGADASLTDLSGLSALDYARRKLIRASDKPRRKPARSPSLDENDQLRLNDYDQEMLKRMRQEFPWDRTYLHIWWQERLKAAKRVFNDPDQLEEIVLLLEAAQGPDGP